MVIVGVVTDSEGSRRSAITLLGTGMTLVLLAGCSRIPMTEDLLLAAGRVTLASDSLASGP